jgi:hypothetical protein
LSHQEIKRKIYKSSVSIHNSIFSSINFYWRRLYKFYFFTWKMKLLARWNLTTNFNRLWYLFISPFTCSQWNTWSRDHKISECEYSKIIQSEGCIDWIWHSDWLFFEYQYKTCTQKFYYWESCTQNHSTATYQSICYIFCLFLGIKRSRLTDEILPKMIVDLLCHDMVKDSTFSIYIPKGTV